MIIPRKIFEVAKIASKDNFKVNLQTVLFRRKHGKPEAIATDGHRAIIARWKEERSEDVPANIIGDISPIPTFSATIEKEAVIKAGKSIPKKTNIPILENVFLREANVNGTAELVTSDLSSQSKVEGKTVEGFPDIDFIFPTGKPKARVLLNSNYLAEMAKVMGAFSDGKTASILIEIFDETTPIRFRARDGEQVESVGLLMPMRGCDEYDKK